MKCSPDGEPSCPYWQTPTADWTWGECTMETPHRGRWAVEGCHRARSYVLGLWLAEVAACRARGGVVEPAVSIPAAEPAPEDRASEGGAE